MPFDKMLSWLKQEEDLNSPNPYNIVLATGSGVAIHSRIVAIREITVKGILFFTQKGSRKVAEIMENPNASMTLWLPLQQREVVVDGATYFLNQNENAIYWETLSRERQLRFSTYAPISGKVIQSAEELQQRYSALDEQYKDKAIPMSECYLGVRLVPHTFYFYTLGKDHFSEVIKYDFEYDKWHCTLHAP